MRSFLFYGDKGRATPFMYGDKGRVLPLTNGDTKAVSHRSGPRALLSSITCHAVSRLDRDLRAVRARFRRAARHDHGPRRSLSTIGQCPHLTPECAASLLASHVSPKCTRARTQRGRA